MENKTGKKAFVAGTNLKYSIDELEYVKIESL